MPPAVPTRLLELAEFEKIAPRGVYKQTWSVRLDNRWVRATRVPGAVIVARPNEPGVVWQRHVQLQLAPGTFLRLTTEHPQPIKPRDVFSVLTLDSRASISVRREEFRLTSYGTLDRLPAK